MLVTGAGGFIGQALCPLLTTAGHDVVTVGRRDGDLSDARTCRRVATEHPADVLVHLAWITDHGAFWEHSVNLAWVGAGLELVHAFREAGGRRVVLAGSVAQLRPTTLYGAAKRALSDVAAAYGRGHGLEVVTAVVFFPYGPGENPRKLVSSLLSGATPLAPDTAVDLIHVYDVARALTLLVDADIEGVVDVGSGEPLTVAQVAAALRGGPPPGDAPADALAADVTRLRQLGFRSALSLEAGLATYRESGTL